MTAAWTDRREVVRHYGQREAGATIFSFREPVRDWYSVLLDRIAWSGSDRALDAGCGGGGYLSAISSRAAFVVGLDLTASQLSHTTRPANPAVPLAAGDVGALPFVDGAFDKILSAHMLYVVPDIPAAVREFRRVLRHGGALLAITNGEKDKSELDDVFVEAGMTKRLDPLLSGSFTLENGASYLEPVFDSVEVHADDSSALVVPDAELVVSWADHWRGIAEGMLVPGLEWDGFLANVRRIAAERVRRDGAFICREQSAVFVCR